MGVVVSWVSCARTLGRIEPDAARRRLDGDGLEQVIIAGDPNDGCAPVIVGCIEGDGTRIDDPNGLFDVADGYSLAMTLRAERASFARPSEAGE